MTEKQLNETPGSSFLDYAKALGGLTTGIISALNPPSPGPVAAAPNISQPSKWNPWVIGGAVAGVVLVLILLIKR